MRLCFLPRGASRMKAPARLEFLTCRVPELKVQEFSFERGLRAQEVVPTITPLSRYGERSAKGKREVSQLG
ncbi:hypothetical protein C7S16_0025 [Burkholderia thailandensis]|uniref:Uncharacterized protein n=1 Tax=Burkholderia thailandensis TaxID=57975 RepID=A0AAW9CZN8_BURTH|nr:hypothetical protein [Burkholderia thailandensis]MDW9255381.1 hypothetical protein [Burkholderia thailandensis]MDW9256895.1 hypothetical protein [Burkholderia thailandensis]